VWQKRNGTLCIIKTKFTIKKKKDLSCKLVSDNQKPAISALYCDHVVPDMFCLQVIFDKRAFLYLLIKITKLCVISIEQRANLKLLVRLDKTPSEALILLQHVYEEDAMSRSRVFEWHKRIK